MKLPHDHPSGQELSMAFRTGRQLPRRLEDEGTAERKYLIQV
jgi:hypothetical protein